MILWASFLLPCYFSCYMFMGAAMIQVKCIPPVRLCCPVPNKGNSIVICCYSLGGQIYDCEIRIILKAVNIKVANQQNLC